MKAWLQMPGLAAAQWGGWPHEAGTAGPTATPHLGAVTVQLEGQHHGPVDVDFLGPVDVLRADLQARTGALPGELGSLRVGGDCPQGAWWGVAHTSPNALGLSLSQRVEVGAPPPWVPLWGPAGSECPLPVPCAGHLASARFPLCVAPGAGQ